MRNWLSKNWVYVTAAVIILGAGGWITKVDTGLAAGGKHMDKIDSAIEKNTEAIHQLTQIQKSMKSQLDVVIALFHLKLKDSTIAIWERMPLSPPLDSTGQPVEGVRWIGMSPDYKTGRMLMWQDNDTIVLEVLWDVTNK